MKVKQLTRDQKIKILQAVQEGKVSIESLQPPRVYMFIENHDKPGFYKMDGKVYDENEYLQFCQRIKDKTPASIIWNETKHYPKEDTIITYRIAKGCEPIKER